MDMSAVGIFLPATQVRLLQPPKGPSETKMASRMSLTSVPLQPPKGPSETMPDFRDTAYL